MCSPNYIQKKISYLNCMTSLIISAIIRINIDIFHSDKYEFYQPDRV